MKKLLILSSSLSLACGCIMINSKSEIGMDAALVKSRTTDIKNTHSSSNSNSVATQMEGGGTVTPNTNVGIPVK